ncbi:pyrroline-5-carboxylate reductase [Phyllobacterium salinisoli]|uniref:Pyrroline-5-carboxylate reductase n=1 Tax=Phyllobacterium salinisoli TaxID=1899321 RepID=A0A368K860_9HYPH|nr:pyrroline-5-carboxylate reductase [Phyllobacterium salinisoli]RCS24663.1 pyrroline-5-carboxylate reductase [Phyllobacterium salinisoli]
MSDTVILVGCGNMGFAMLKGWIDSDALRPGDVHVVEPADGLRERAAKLGVHAVAESSSLAPDLKPRMVLVAVKPQVMTQVIPTYARFAGATTFVSVAAGIPVALFETYLGDKAAIIRCMPNTPSAIGKGMLVTYANANVRDEDAAFVANLLKTSGQVASIADESLMDAVTAVSGSGPAYVFHFIECLTDAGITAGLERDTAALLAMQTVYGAGALAAGSSDSPSKLREQVTSPNGTTAAALAVLMGENRLKSLVEEAVEAAKRRSAELGKS